MPMETINLAASELLPHRRGMLLTDEALCGDETGIVGRATVKADNLFARNGSIGSWVLIEYMAQTMAMWTSWNARQKGLPPPVGFLLGTRRLDLLTEHVAVGSVLTCKASRIFVSVEDGVAQFQCEAYCNGQLLAKAAINAFEPKNIESFLTEH